MVDIHLWAVARRDSFPDNGVRDTDGSVSCLTLTFNQMVEPADARKHSPTVPSERIGA